MAAIIDIGEAMLEVSGEVSRVETSLTLLARAYGYTRINAYSTLLSIIVSAEDCNGRVITHTRRITRTRTDLHRLEQLNALSRRLCAEPAPVEDIAAALEAIRSGPRYPAWLMCLLYFIIPMNMSLFFGATFGESWPPPPAALCSGT